MPARIEMVGRRFGRLLVVGDKDAGGALIGSPGYRLVSVVCDCGTAKIVAGRSLRKGHCKSCGCLRLDAIVTHGLDSHPLCSVWRNMNARCYKPTAISYKYYGARGISVCPEWRDGPVAFVAWAKAAGWAPRLQIDRRDNEGN